jgi:hypothetical protein
MMPESIPSPNDSILPAAVNTDCLLVNRFVNVWTPYVLSFTTEASPRLGRFRHHGSNVSRRHYLDSRGGLNRGHERLTYNIHLTCTN